MPPRDHSLNAPEAAATPAYAVRRIGRVNWGGLYTLYLKEVWRFFKVITQTVVAPAVTTLLFMAIFTLALGGQGRGVAGIPFEMFLAPGLIVMAILQNAFANTSSSIMIAKVQGNIVDVLMPPLSAGELTFAYTMGGVTRGLLVGVVVGVAMLLFTPIHVEHWWAVLYFSLNAALMLSLLGILTGIWAEKFDHTAAVTNFVVTPLSFLSGTFYSIDRLPGVWRDVSQFNPFFYMIDGVRYGFIGRADGSIATGVAVLAALNVALWVLCHALFKSGYKLRP
ncbi:MAG: multidrug ABC transporter permease [Alphaproteobacteria bacterium]|nr:MAG: multidrug ABC transporter permease [Alphaproteobacteria bacterium]